MKPLVLLTCLMALSAPVTGMAGIKDWFKSQEQKDQEIAHSIANFYRQRTIEKYHLLAHAQSIEVMRFIWVDSAGNPVKDTTSLQATTLVVDYVIRWAGPVNKGGMTRVVSAFDFTRKNAPVIGDKVLSTNGVLNEDAATTAGEVLGALLN